MIHVIVIWVRRTSRWRSRSLKQLLNELISRLIDRPTLCLSLASCALQDDRLPTQRLSRPSSFKRRRRTQSRHNLVPKAVSEKSGQRWRLCPKYSIVCVVPPFDSKSQVQFGYADCRPSRKILPCLASLERESKRPTEPCPSPSLIHSPTRRLQPRTKLNDSTLAIDLPFCPCYGHTTQYRPRKISATPRDRTSSTPLEDAATKRIAPPFGRARNFGSRSSTAPTDERRTLRNRPFSSRRIRRRDGTTRRPSV